MTLSLSLLPSFVFYLFDDPEVKKKRKKLKLVVFCNILLPSVLFNFFHVYTGITQICKVRLEFKFFLSVDFTVSMDVMSKKATHATSFSMFHLDYSFWKCSSLMKCVPFTTTDANGLLKFKMDCTPWAHIGNKGDNQMRMLI